MSEVDRITVSWPSWPSSTRKLTVPPRYTVGELYRTHWRRQIYTILSVPDTIRSSCAASHAFPSHRQSRVFPGEALAGTLRPLQACREDAESCNANTDCFDGPVSSRDPSGQPPLMDPKRGARNTRVERCRLFSSRRLHVFALARIDAQDKHGVDLFKATSLRLGYEKVHKAAPAKQQEAKT